MMETTNILVEDNGLNIRIENFRDRFRLFWKEDGNKRFIELSEPELNAFYNMLIDGESRLKKRITKRSMLLCKAKGGYKGKIWVYYKGDVQVEWGYFLRKFSPMDFYNLVTIFKRTIDKMHKLHAIERRKIEEKEHYIRLYFYSGLFSVGVTLIASTTTIAFLFMAYEFVVYPFMVFGVSIIYSAIFFYFQQKNAANFKAEVSENFVTKLLPVLHVLPFNSKKLVELFIVLWIVFTLMSVYFAKAVPKIIDFYKGLTPG